MSQATFHTSIDSPMETKRKISRRTFIGLAAAGAAVTAALSTSIFRKNKDKRPNFIVILADDASAKEFGCYGNDEHNTPVLDELAQTGTLFKTCWCTPICSSSRAEIMTGRYGFRTGWYHNKLKPEKGKTGYVLGRDNKTFAQLLKDAGYATAISGKWQLRGSAFEHGFDEFCLWGDYIGFDGPVEKPGNGARIGRVARYWHPAIVTNAGPVKTTSDDYGPDIFTDFLLDFAKRKKDSPFIAYYPMCLPHNTWDFRAKRTGYLRVPRTNSNGERVPGTVPGSLKSNIEYMDVLLGRIVKRLSELGLREDTIILFTSDNGTSKYGKNRTFREVGQRVPMVVNCPGRVKSLGAIDTLVDLSDVLPTLCDLSDTPLPADYAIDGQSFSHTIQDKPGPEREWIFSYSFDRRMLRDHRWLLDGDGRLWDCGNRRDEKNYNDVTDSDAPEVLAARERFNLLLDNSLPGPPRELVNKAREEGRRGGWSKMLPPPLPLNG